MSIISFPLNPIIGQEHTADNGQRYTWTGNRWQAVVGTSTSANITVGLFDNSNILSNAVSNPTTIGFDQATGFNVTEIDPGVVKVSLGSTFKTWKVNGQSDLVALGEDTIEFVAGNNISITTDTNTNPKQLIIESTGSGGGTTDRLIAGSKSVVLGTDGTLTLPQGATLVPYANSIDIKAASGGYAELISSGNDNAIWVDDAGAYVVTNGSNEWTFGYDNYLKFPATGSTAGIKSASGTQKVHFTNDGVKIDADSTHAYTFGLNGTITMPYGKLGVTPGETFGISAGADTAATIQANNGSKTWSFDGNGNLVLPAGGDIVDTDGNSVLGGSGGGGNPFDQDLNTTNSPTFGGLSLGSGGVSLMYGSDIYTGNQGGIDLYTDWETGEGVEVWLQHNNRVSITTGSGSYEWSFDNNGVATSPHNIIQQSSGIINCLPNQDTVVYTATNLLTSTIKALFHVEGVEQGTQNYEAQSCEIMVARMSTKVSGSVYGLTYTSNGPLATFNTRINSITGLVEITCRPSGTTEQVSVTTTATEMLTTP